MTKQERDYLSNICRRCIKANGKCIKDDPYIGLCAEVDAEELLDGAKRAGVLK